MEKIQQWSDQWLVNLNQRKTETMVISNKCINPHHPPIYMNDAIMREVEQHKHLGVIFHSAAL
jgi:RNase adaptor protein for sRNA GlmZ degradation